MRVCTPAGTSCLRLINAVHGSALQPASQQPHAHQRGAWSAVLGLRPRALRQGAVDPPSPTQVLKRVINQQRPPQARQADPGMPSSHAQCERSPLLCPVWGSFCGSVLGWGVQAAASHRNRDRSEMLAPPPPPPGPDVPLPRHKVPMRMHTLPPPPPPPTRSIGLPFNVRCVELF